MAEKSKTREITITEENGTFTTIFKRFASSKKFDYDSISLLRQVLSNQRARLINILKTKKPESIYSLAKLLQRDFKSVSDDVKLLEKFGILELISEKVGKRERLKPVLVIDTLYLKVKF